MQTFTIRDSHAASSPERKTAPKGRIMLGENRLQGGDKRRGLLAGKEQEGRIKHRGHRKGRRQGKQHGRGEEGKRHRKRTREQLGVRNAEFAGKHALDVRVKSLSTLGNPDWKRNTYDASLAWYLKTEKFSPIVELGYRYLDSRTKGIDNYGNAYLTIGLRY